MQLQNNPMSSGKSTIMEQYIFIWNHISKIYYQIRITPIKYIHIYTHYKVFFFGFWRRIHTIKYNPQIRHTQTFLNNNKKKESYCCFANQWVVEQCLMSHNHGKIIIIIITIHHKDNDAHAYSNTAQHIGPLIAFDFFLLKNRDICNVM